MGRAASGRERPRGRDVAEALDTWRVHGLELAVGEPEALLRERALARRASAPSELRGFRIARRRSTRGARAARAGCASSCTSTSCSTRARARRRSSARCARGASRARPRSAGSRSSACTTRSRARAWPWSAPGRRASSPRSCSRATASRVDAARPRRADRASAARDAERASTARACPIPRRNLLFGEGGAGTYSDGKLYTRVEHPLEVAAARGARRLRRAGPRSLYDARAHVGTDRLHRILPRCARGSRRAGVRFHWRTRVERARARRREPRAACARSRTSRGELALRRADPRARAQRARHLARARGARASRSRPSPSSSACASSTRRRSIDRGAPRRGAARPRCSARPTTASRASAGDGAPGAHSFCMCPGGQIVASVTEPGPAVHERHEQLAALLAASRTRRS